MDAKNERGAGDAGNNGLDLNVCASEASKGGLKFEVVLSQATVPTPPRSMSPTHQSSRPLVSVEKIQQKLELAAERRQSLESEKLASLQEKWKKIDEAAKKRAEEELNFINHAKGNLEQKMEAVTGNRETIMTDLKVKLSNHNTNHLQEVRQNLESSVSEFEGKVKEDLDKKLEVAEQNREKVIQTKLESLKKHEEKVEQIRSLKKNSSMPEDESNENAENVVVTD
ncbi:myosin-1 [Folsomia candida]|uniref:Stathmin n=1 Tax=Folsomia candida TaxID=158441 RepID=A0A226F6Y5_FOLCA|nr:myosin-1 [Folsomia candida]XP_021961177.1 myosin-1 [Folsomia candida]OXA65208.1 Stathmin [Folsomia candida]